LKPALAGSRSGIPRFDRPSIEASGQDHARPVGLETRKRPSLWYEVDAGDSQRMSLRSPDTKNLSRRKKAAPCCVIFLGSTALSANQDMTLVLLLIAEKRLFFLCGSLLLPQG
jgi:hypothetical protein